MSVSPVKIDYSVWYCPTLGLLRRGTLNMDGYTRQSCALGSKGSEACPYQAGDLSAITCRCRDGLTASQTKQEMFLCTKVMLALCHRLYQSLSKSGATYRSKIFPESSLLRYASWSCSLDVLSRTASILPSPHVSPLSSELWLGTLRLTLGSTLAKAGLLHLPCTSRSSSLTARLERPATGHRRARIRSAAVGRSREHVEATGESRDPHPRRPEGARGGRAAPPRGRRAAPLRCRRAFVMYDHRSTMLVKDTHNPIFAPTATTMLLDTIYYVSGRGLAS